MWIILVPLLILIAVIISYLLLDKLIIQNFEEDRESIKAVVKNTDFLSRRVFDFSRNIIRQQQYLDSKMDALAALVDQHSTSVRFTQEQFNALVRADVLSARREELRRLKELKVVLERVMSSAMISRQPPSSNDVIALENITNRIEELEKITDKE